MDDNLIVNSNINLIDQHGPHDINFLSPFSNALKIFFTKGGKVHIVLWQLQTPWSTRFYIIILHAWCPDLLITVRHLGTKEFPNWHNLHCVCNAKISCPQKSHKFAGMPFLINNYALPLLSCSSLVICNIWCYYWYFLSLIEFLPMDICRKIEVKRIDACLLAMKRNILSPRPEEPKSPRQPW